MRDRWWVLLGAIVGLPGAYLFMTAFEDNGATVNRAQALIGLGIMVVAMCLGAHALLNWFDRNEHLFAESTHQADEAIDTDTCPWPAPTMNGNEPHDPYHVESTPVD